jgi:succinyl-CoA synthetase alpha subunit
VVSALNRANLGESITIHLGSDPIVGSSCRQWLEYLQKDPTTKAIVILDDIFWDTEESTAFYFSNNLDKPIVAYLPGIHGNTPKPLADALVILDHTVSKLVHDADTVQRKINAFRKAKIPVAKKPSQIPQIIKRIINK